MQNYEQIHMEIKCPICHADSAQRLWGVSNEQAAQHFVLQEKNPERFIELALYIEKLWGQNKCEVVQCDKCGFCYCNPYIGGDERFYSHAYDHSGYPRWKWEFQQTYAVLNQFSGAEFKLLEIGAGDGAFIRRISKKILSKENILCTEFSEYGRHQIEKFGVKCLSDDVRNFSRTDFEKSIDIICMFQVLEHMDKLDVLFCKLNWLMKSGGSLFIAVPNPKNIEFSELNDGLLDMPPNHIGRWNKKCFEEISKQYGFYIKDFKVEKSNFTAIAKQFVIYRYFRNSQRRGSIENKIQTIKNRYLLRIMQIIGVFVNSIIAIPSLFKVNSRMGNSQWVHLIKKE